MVYSQHTVKGRNVSKQIVVISIPLCSAPRMQSVNNFSHWNTYSRVNFRMGAIWSRFGIDTEL